MTDAAPEPPAKKARSEPAFTESRPLSSFVPESVLKFEGGGRLAVVRGKLAHDAGAEPEDALLTLEQKPACADADALVASLPSFALSLTNHSGAEYSFYCEPTSVLATLAIATSFRPRASDAAGRTGVPAHCAGAA